MEMIHGPDLTPTSSRTSIQIATQRSSTPFLEDQKITRSEPRASLEAYDDFIQRRTDSPGRCKSVYGKHASGGSLRMCKPNCRRTAEETLSSSDQRQHLGRNYGSMSPSRTTVRFLANLKAHGKDRPRSSPLSRKGRKIST